MFPSPLVLHYVGVTVRREVNIFQQKLDFRACKYSFEKKMKTSETFLKGFFVYTRVAI